MPNPDLKDEYVERNPTDVAIQCIPEYSEHEVCSIWLVKSILNSEEFFNRRQIQRDSSFLAKGSFIFKVNGCFRFNSFSCPFSDLFCP